MLCVCRLLSLILTCILLPFLLFFLVVSVRFSVPLGTLRIGGLRWVINHHLHVGLPVVCDGNNIWIVTKPMTVVTYRVGDGAFYVAAAGFGLLAIFFEVRQQRITLLCLRVGADAE